MPGRSWRLIAVTIPLLSSGLLTACAAEVVEQVPASGGGELLVDIALGSGFSFDKGSLTLTSHQRDEVRVVTDVSGWGGYAVDVRAEEISSGVRVVGRVEGRLHWMFGGPTVDVRIAVPPDYRIEARIEDAPIILEDLIGPIAVRTDQSDLNLTRARGEVRVVSKRGSVEATHVDGVLTVETRDGSIRIEQITGDLLVESRSGDIALRDVDGDLEARSGSGEIDVKNLAGSVNARSGSGDIEIDFRQVPVGVIEAKRGDITVAVPRDAAFHLDAQTGFGGVEIDEDIPVAYEPVPENARADGAAGELARRGSRFAGRLSRRIRRAIEEHLRDDGRPDGSWGERWHGWGRHDDEALSGREPADEADPNGLPDVAGSGDAADPPPGSDAPSPHPELDDFEWGDLADLRSLGSSHVRGTVNGGGPALEIRTGFGSIQIDDL